MENILDPFTLRVVLGVALIVVAVLWVLAAHTLLDP